MRACAGELALVNDEVLGTDRLLGEIAFEDLASAGGIARLWREKYASALSSRFKHTGCRELIRSF